MIYLIGQLSIWLLLTAAFAAVAGWAWAAERNAASERGLRRDRDNLMRDLIRLAQGDGGSDGAIESERETDATRRLLEIKDARIAELEQAAETARASANDAAGERAELQRRLEQGSPAENEELTRLRALVAEREVVRAPVNDDIIDAEITPVIDEEAMALQTWRLRYFEQRVRYLEGLAREGQAAPAAEPEADLPLEWRARDAEARAAFLEQALRERAAPAPAEAAPAEPETEEPPFAANADVDVLLRWRLLYLERRVAYLQEEVAQDAVLAVAEPTPKPEPDAAPDPDRWKWRARYLEARVRHLEQRPAAPLLAAAATTNAESESPPAPPPSRRAKPAILAAARNGAPDDFTLIEGVSLQQQSTLYSIGVFHFDQIAAWSTENVAWIDQYLRLGGRIDDEEWVEQADDLAREGPAAARRVLDAEDI
jgi:predicted flap endonuclease-1-like 5' DNA nuclease